MKRQRITRIIILLGFLISMSVPSGAQPERKPFDFNKLNEKRFELIAHELNLDERTEAKLKPVYIEYCQKLGELFKPQDRPMWKEKLTDEEMDKNIRGHFNHERKVLNIRETYYNKFRKYLSPKQILQIYQIEKREMMKIENARKNHRKRK